MPKRALVSIAHDGLSVAPVIMCLWTAMWGGCLSCRPPLGGNA
ncbi:MAG: hypothetical protein ACYC05_02750 [Sulfuricella sp.]